MKTPPVRLKLFTGVWLVMTERMFCHWFVFPYFKNKPYHFNDN